MCEYLKALKTKSQEKRKAEDARRRREAFLDKLKERRSEEYYDRQIDEEFKTIDEINTAAAARR